jgi:hypothetical protein
MHIACSNITFFGIFRDPIRLPPEFPVSMHDFPYPSPWLSSSADYYNYFPPKSMNVEIKSNDSGRRIMLATKDIAAGETIYKASDVSAIHLHQFY